MWMKGLVRLVNDTSSGNTLSFTATATDDGDGFDVPGSTIEGAGIGTISRLTINVNVAENEHLDNTALSIAIDGFDDGLYLEVNGVVVVVNSWFNA